MDAFTTVFPLGAQDLAAVAAFRRVSLAIYAKFMSARRATGGLDPQLDDARELTLGELSRSR